MMVSGMQGRAGCARPITINQSDRWRLPTSNDVRNRARAVVAFSATRHEVILVGSTKFNMELPSLRNKKLKSQAKIMLLNVARFFRRKKLELASSSGEDMNVNKTIAEATGVSMTTVKKILAQSHSETPEEAIKSPSKKRKHNPKIEIDQFTEGVIRRKINMYYTHKKELPTLKNILQELKDDGILNSGREFIRKYLHKIGFQWKKLQRKRCLLVENADIVYKRHHYLLKVKKHREEGRNIVYVDETYVNSSHTPYKCWQSKKYKQRGLLKEIGAGSRLVVVHAGGAQGFVNDSLLIFKSKSKSGHYHDDMNHENFKKWTENKLLPNLLPNSTVVIDNAAYHNVEIDKKPTKSALKQTMLTWLQNHNMPCSATMLRSQLYELIQSVHIEKKIVFDEILKSHGHEVLRLPPYHADLNPIELVWGYVINRLGKSDISTNLNKKSDELKQIFAEYSTDQWKKCVDHVLKIENDYLHIDRLTDSNYDGMYQPFLLNLSEDTSSESSSNSESENDSDESTTEKLKIKQEDSDE